MDGNDPDPIPFGPGFLMDFMPRGSLRDVLEQTKRGGVDIPWDARRAIAAQICDGMTFLHAKGFLHRDIKAANVLVVGDAGWTVQIADFGSAKMQRLHQSTTGGGGKGTLRWKSPQRFQVPSIPYSKLDDVFSFGIMLVELVTREFPWGDLEDAQVNKCLGECFKVNQRRLKRGESEEDQRLDWLDEYPLLKRRPCLDGVEEGCPPELLEMIARCWVDGPESRPTFAVMWAEMLRREEPPPPPPPPSPPFDEAVVPPSAHTQAITTEMEAEKAKGDDKDFGVLKTLKDRRDAARALDIEAYKMQLACEAEMAAMDAQCPGVPLSGFSLAIDCIAQMEAAKAEGGDAVVAAVKELKARMLASRALDIMAHKEQLACGARVAELDARKTELDAQYPGAVEAADALEDYALCDALKKGTEAAAVQLEAAGARLEAATDRRGKEWRAKAEAARQKAAKEAREEPARVEAARVRAARAEAAARQKAKHTGHYVAYSNVEAWDCCMSHEKNSTYCKNTAYCDGCKQRGGHWEGYCQRYKKN
jgi:hypothetical protein